MNYVEAFIEIASGYGMFTPSKSKVERIFSLAYSLHDTYDSHTVLDLASHDGFYSFFLARHGFDVIGIEGREGLVNKSNDFLKKEFRYINNLCRFFHDDVRNLSFDKYGEFDITICNGILYHLQAEDAFNLLRTMQIITNDAVILDTHFAYQYDDSIDIPPFGKVRYAKIAEPDSVRSALDKVSHWIYKPDLFRIIDSLGYKFAYEVKVPECTDTCYLHDRLTAILIP